MAVLSNATASAVAENVQNHQAGGRAIFWALTTLALNAMYQPSFSGYVCSGNIFKGSLWPHRSSPFVCLADAAADIWLIANRSRTSSSDDEEDERSPSIGIVIRLAIFVLGVLPQAIKLFCMRGVLVSQFVAAAFLLSTLVSFIRSLHLDDPDKELFNLADRVKDQRPKFQFDFRFFSCLPNLAIVCTIWSSNSAKIRIDLPHDIAAAYSWISVIITTMCSAYVAQHLVFMTIRGKPYLRRIPAVSWILCLNTPSLIATIIDGRTTRVIAFEAYFVLHLAICCYLITRFFERVVERWAARSSSANPIETSVESQASTTDEAGGTLTAHDNASVIPSTSATADIHDLTPSSQTSVPTDSTSDQQLTQSTPEISSTSAAVDIRDPAPINQTRNASDTTIDQTHTRNAPEDAPLPPNDPIPTASAGVSTEQAAVANGQPAEVAPEPDNSFGSKIFDAILSALVYPAVAILLICSYSGLWNPEATEEQAEEGRAGVPDGQDITEVSVSPPSTINNIRSQGILSRILKFADTAARLIVKRLIITIWRFFLAFISIFLYASIRAEAHLKEHAKDTFWLAFGLLNFVTLATYYMVFYDGKNTYSPSWTSLLG